MRNETKLKLRVSFAVENDDECVFTKEGCDPPNMDAENAKTALDLLFNAEPIFVPAGLFAGQNGTNLYVLDQLRYNN